MFVPFLLFIGGLVLLVKGADWLVDGASDIAHKHGVSQWVIGVTIIAFGTSVPELTISSLAAWQGKGDIAVGNIIGSNIANIGLVIGLSASILAIKLHNNRIQKEMLFVIVSAFLMMLFPLNLLGTTDLPTIGRIKGLFLLVIFGIFLYYLINDAKGERHEAKKSKAHVVQSVHSSWKDFLLIIIGIAATLIGAKLMVDAGVSIATSFGVSEAVIALTLIAFGTSLPEFVTSVVASFKGKAELSLGNIVGSNIFNILWVIGVASLVKPLTISPRLVVDAGVMVIFSIALFMIMSTTNKISRTAGVGLLLGYILFIVVTV